MRRQKWTRILAAGLLLCVGCRQRPQVSITSGIEEPEDRWVRVLLFGNLKECTLSSYSSLEIEDRETAGRVRFGTPYQTIPVHCEPEALWIGEHRFRNDVMIRTETPFVFELNGLPFRGHLQLVQNAEGGISAVNYVPLESYLCGVVPAEMQSYWEPEALKAQAVACRTYSLYIKYRFGSGRRWDLRRTQANQVYQGLLAETAPTNKAVSETDGQVLVCPDAQGQWRLFPAYYSSVCGGHTENSRNVFGDIVRALEGVPCPYCRQTARSEFFFWTGVSFTRQALTEQLQQRYPVLIQLGEIQQVEPAQVSENGRVTSVRLTGAKGQIAFLRGEDFRLAADPSGQKLRSSIFTIQTTSQGFEFVDGRGFGHGVGLCQNGAQTLAKQGKLYTEITEYYYPGSRIVRLAEY